MVDTIGQTHIQGLTSYNFIAKDRPPVPKVVYAADLPSSKPVNDNPINEGDGHNKFCATI
ncbi:hypothetical protein Bca4012_083611 [Brassica carinata]|uniref:Uncharacterized protein n=1 Tax=Brassica carinata TaxID=52824 RepID=A0A8X7V8K1_BRACI|nr:hypothetical protein Bca52824_027113 [Brassica carinata]